MFYELVLILFTTILITYFYFNHCFQYWKKCGVPQLTPSFPFGNMSSVFLRKQNMGDEIKQIYDQAKSKGYKFIGLYFLYRKVFLPIDPILIKHILSNDFQYFNDRGIYYDEKNDPISAHLFSLSGTKWKCLRSKLTPAYSPGKLKFMFNTILDCGNQMINLLNEYAKTKQMIEIKEIFARYTTDVIGSCAFGIECNSIRNPNAEFRLMGKRAFIQTINDHFRMIIMRAHPPLAKLFKLSVFTRNVTQFFQNAVRNTIEYRERNNIQRNDFLQLLIQLKNNGKLDDDNNDEKFDNLTIDEASAQAFIFFLAGFETTSTTISFALLELAMNCQIQKDARFEVEQILQKYNSNITYDALMEMQYLEMIILETMRKYPPAPVFLRKCTKTYQIPETDIIIEKGLTVLIPAYGLHRDTEYFPNPNLFDPKRFSKKNKSNLRDYTYIPFGDGPRNCIGMRFAMIQMKIALSLILNNFEFCLNQKTKLPIKMETKGIILAAIGGIWLDLIQIKKKPTNLS